MPSELVVDHSVIADVFGQPDAFERNVEIEYSRNSERYRFLRWGQSTLRNFAVVPPGTGIMHQVNVEYLARVVMVEDGWAFPDVCLGTDSHTTMVNGLGVLAWGIGGIEAEAVMLGQSLSMLLPPVVGFRLHGALPEGPPRPTSCSPSPRSSGRTVWSASSSSSTARGGGDDGRRPRDDLEHEPEFGSTCAFFPIDDETLRYLRFTGRPDRRVDLVEAYAKEQGLWHDPAEVARYSEFVELDLASVVPSLAGPSRPQQRVPLDRAKAGFRSELHAALTADAAPAADTVSSWADEASEESFPASDAPAIDSETAVGVPAPAPVVAAAGAAERPPAPVEVTLDGQLHELHHGSVAIAAITSCTNTSNPSVMVTAAILARNAVERGLRSKPWVKTSLSPGSRVVTDYFDDAGLTPTWRSWGSTSRATAA